MNPPEDNTQELLAKARDLVRELESGNRENAHRLLDELSDLRESKLFQELGRLTRNLHEALNGVPVDPDLARLSEHDIPDARERLHYVVTKTEEAAHRTLKAVEDSIPLARRLTENASAHKQHWEKFLRRQMDVNEFRELTRSLGEFLAGVIADSSSLHRSLSDVLMAQDYQDLTGQVIQRVMSVVEEVENRLVEMIRARGRQVQAQAGMPAAGGLEGPQISAKARPDVVANQDEVDQLLSSLGF